MALFASFPSGTIIDPPLIVDLTIPAAAWVGSGIPYTQIVTVPGVTSNNYVTISPTETIVYDQYKALSTALIQGTDQSEGSVTLTAFGEKPSIDIPLRFIITNWDNV